MSIVITGNPGVGKHTIAKEILKYLELSMFDINNFARDSGLFEVKGNDYEVDVDRLGKIINESFSDRTLIVGHLAPYVISPKKIYKVIVLRRDPYELMQVYKKRRYTDEKARENTGSEILGIIAHDAITRFGDKVFQINTSGKSIREVLQISISIIKNTYYFEEIDWLKVVAKKNDWKKFFVY